LFGDFPRAFPFSGKNGPVLPQAVPSTEQFLLGAFAFTVIPVSAAQRQQTFRFLHASQRRHRLFACERQSATSPFAARKLWNRIGTFKPNDGEAM
jgi:hypothetical protein